MSNLLNSSTILSINGNVDTMEFRGVQFSTFKSVDFNNRVINVVQSESMGKLIDMGMVINVMTPIGDVYTAK